MSKFSPEQLFFNEISSQGWAGKMLFKRLVWAGKMLFNRRGSQAKE